MSEKQNSHSAATGGNMRMSQMFFATAVSLMVACGGSVTPGVVPSEVPPVVQPQPEPTPTPTPEPPPIPAPDLFVHDVTFHVTLHSPEGPVFEGGVTLSLVRAGVTVQQAVVQDGVVVIPSMLPGDAEVQLSGLRMLHQYENAHITISNESKEFQIVVGLRDHGKTQVFGDSNTSYEPGNRIPATFVQHLGENPLYSTALNNIAVEIDNRAKGGSGLTDVWNEPERYGALQVRDYFKKMNGVAPAVVLFRYGLIDIRNKWHADDFEQELRGIVELALSHGVVPVLNYVSYQKGRDEAATDECNRIFDRVAADYGLPLVDLALRWSPEYYFDEEHQSDEGNKVVAEYAAEVILRWLTSGHS